MVEYTVPCKGIVAYSQHDWKWEAMLTREPKEDEFLVEMIATGVCHTDISGYGGIYPRVLGHEGISPLESLHPPSQASHELEHRLTPTKARAASYASAPHSNPRVTASGTW
jgi:hypothetical protein